MKMMKKLIFFCILVVTQGKRLKIINGDDAELGEFPFQVSIQSDDGVHFCSGSILNENYVITAAHCFASGNPVGIKVVVGLKLHEPYMIRKVIWIRKHEGYNRRDSVKNDIAILRVNEEFVFNNKTSPVTLPKRNDQIPDLTKASISGWGMTEASRYSSPENLKKAKVTVISHDNCVEFFKSIQKTIYPGQLCTLETSGKGRGPCDYDSGGPLTISGHILIGIISWGQKNVACGTLGQPNVYTRVSEYIDWIENNTKLDEFDIFLPDYN